MSIHNLLGNYDSVGCILHFAQRGPIERRWAVPEKLTSIGVVHLHVT